MDNQPTSWAVFSFAEQVKAGQDPVRPADRIVSAWVGIDSVMRQILGKGGFNALFFRSIEVTGLSYPWLVAHSHDGQSVVNFTDLRAMLLRQDAILFATASDALLLYFFNMVVDLIGLSLTERLLRPVLDPLLTVMP